MTHAKRICRAVPLLVAVLALPAVHAQEAKVDKIVDVGLQRNEAAKAAQQQVDKIAEQTDDLVREYKTIMKVVDGLKVYNALLQRQVDAQQAQIDDLGASIDQVAIVQRQISPLMLRMVEGLSQFVELDVPFLLEERRQRVQKLRDLMERADVTAAEKFRAVLEAYDIENEYGRTIEAYRGTLEIEGTVRDVDFLRVGRIALLYQTIGGGYNGMWDQERREWVPLQAVEYANQIEKGLQIARKQVAPDMMLLPVAAPEDVR